MTQLSERDIRQEEEFMSHIARFNWGAFLMPGIWGPAHGVWVSIVFYPLWLLVDNLIFSAYQNPQPLSISLATIALVIIIAFSFAFARISHPYAAHRAIDRGLTFEQYNKRQRIWALVSLLLALAALAWATYYNLTIRAIS